DLKKQTAGDFVFLANGGALASTLPAAESARITEQYHRDPNLQRLNLAGGEFAVLGGTLRDIEGTPVGDLLTVQTFDSIRRDMDALLRKVVLVVVSAILGGLR